MDETPADFAELAAELRRATDNHADANRLARDARNAETAALARLNAAQEAMAAAMAEVMKAAPPDSAWGQSRHGVRQ